MVLVVLMNGWRIVCKREELIMLESVARVRGLEIWLDDIMMISTDEEDYYPGEQNK